MQTPGLVRKERGRCAGAEIPRQPVVRGQAVPVQPTEDHGGADAPLPPWRTLYQSRWLCPKAAATQREAHAGAGAGQEGAAETRCDELTTTPPSAALARRR